LRNLRWILLSLVLTFGLLSGHTVTSHAQEATVRLLYFYTPTCPNCKIVSQQVFPALREQYGTQLEILEVDASVADGSAFFQETLAQLNVPSNRRGVPFIVIGESTLVGSLEIPEQLPGLIAAHLAAGGLDWPDLPGIETWVARGGTEPRGPSLEERWAQDPAGNAVAVALLVVMLVMLLLLSRPARWQQRLARRLPSWATFADGAVGLGAAVYLTYVETQHVEAFCGPVGRCNVVQQSQYALVFGFIPLALIGVLGYVALLSTYAYGKWGKGELTRYAPLAFFGMAWFGFLTSIALTYLQPFVIGATCFWCLTSAASMTLMLTFNSASGWAAVKDWQRKRRKGRRRTKR
jgi:uncharacterized membrane protein